MIIAKHSLESDHTAAHRHLTSTFPVGHFLPNIRNSAARHLRRDLLIFTSQDLSPIEVLGTALSEGKFYFAPII